MTWRLLTGDARGVLRELDEHSIDAVVTDPPYGIGFMGSGWDTFDPRTLPERIGTRNGNGPPSDVHDGRSKGRSVSAFANGAGEAGAYDLSPTANRRFQAWCEAWASEVLRVLKPGGHLVVFGGARTYHRMVAGVEDAGIEVRDQLCWLFGQGFPKSRDLGDGWGTALKPGHEPILLARKPCEGPVSANAIEHGTGGLNIDATRIELTDQAEYGRNHSGDRGHAGTRSIEDRGATDLRMGGGSAAGARWPSNVALNEDAAALLDEQSGELTSGANPTRRSSDKFRAVYGDFAGQEECAPARRAETGGASRFFYCAKTSSAERNIGGPNNHPTVKPIALMQWLVRLVTPAAGTVLDPFCGSGTTGIAALREDFDFIGIERDPEYVSIARARIVADAPLINQPAEAVA